MGLYQVEYLDSSDGGIVLDFRFVTARDVACVETIAKLGLCEIFAGEGYRVRDQAGEVVASSLAHA